LNAARCDVSGIIAIFLSAVKKILDNAMQGRYTCEVSKGNEVFSGSIESRAKMSSRDHRREGDGLGIFYFLALRF